MLPKKYRASRSDIEKTVKNGTFIPGMFLYAKISKNNMEKPSFAIVISKKTEKTSVGRHRIKRKISGFLEKELSAPNPNFKKTLVFFVKKVEKPIFYSGIEKDVTDILKKSGF